MWGPAAGGAPIIQDIHPGGFLSSVAKAVNANGNTTGQVVNTTGEQPFFLPMGGAHQFLGTLGGVQASGQALNDKDEVVGYSYLASGDFHGFYWKPGEMISDLETSLQSGIVWLFNRADGINSDGYIAGTGRNASYRIRGALLRSLGPPVNPTRLNRSHWATVFIHLIAGAVAGNRGIGIVLGGGVVPIPPRPVDRYSEIEFENQDALLLLMMSEVARGIDDTRTRTAIQRALLEATGHAINGTLKDMQQAE
jgi:probable HAF family extracellular repeat protein